MDLPMEFFWPDLFHLGMGRSWGRISHCTQGCPGIYFVTKARLEVEVIPLQLPPQCWGYRWEPTHLGFFPWEQPFGTAPCNNSILWVLPKCLGASSQGALQVLYLRGQTFSSSQSILSETDSPKERMSFLPKEFANTIRVISCIYSPWAV